MPKRYNISGQDLVIDWGTGVVHHGEPVDNDDVDALPTGHDWSDDPKDAQRVATAGASVLTDEEKAAYLDASPRKGRKSTGAASTTDGTAPEIEATTPAVPADEKES